MDKRLYDLIQLDKQNNELAQILEYNDKSINFGLSLTTEDAKTLMICRNETLKKYKRVEFGSGILDKLVFTFCDSSYINQDDYLETLIRLQDVFYAFKNEAEDKMSDDEVLMFMKEQYENVCAGEITYLESTCLPRFSKAVRAGYDAYIQSGGSGEYATVDEEERWSRETYLEVIKALFWR